MHGRIACYALLAIMLFMIQSRYNRCINCEENARIYNIYRMCHTALLFPAR